MRRAPRTLARLAAVRPFRGAVANSAWLGESLALSVNRKPQALVCARRQTHTLGEAIQPEEVSFMMEDASACGAASSDANTASSSSSGAGGRHEALRTAASDRLPTIFEEVRVVDTFARARVVNFARRHVKAAAGAAESSKTVFQTEPVGSAEWLYHCRAAVPLPHPETGGELWAHGVACSEREAELLAAMHAERIIDALGYPLYTLPSMQRRHALAARAAGRAAPSPDDVEVYQPPAPEAFPPPLRRVLVHDETEGGAWQLVSDVRGPSGGGFQSPSPVALLSPAVLDPAAQSRVGLLLRSKGHLLSHQLHMETEPPAEEGAAPFFIASLVLPAEVWKGEAAPPGQSECEGECGQVVARGKALEKEIAVSLACMHAELLLDTLGAPIFPQDDAKQKAHAIAAWGFGRAAPMPGAPSKSPAHVVLPLPLKAWAPPRAGSGGGDVRFSAPGREEDLVHRHRIVAAQTTEFHTTDHAESSAVHDLQRFLRAQRYDRAGSPFFHESIQGVVKSTVVLPVSDAFGIRGGVGIALRGADADVLAAMHALDILTALGVPIEATPEAHARWVAERARQRREHHASAPASIARIEAADPSPPGWRLASGCKTFRGSFAVGGGATNEADSGVTAVAAAGSDVPVRPRRVAKRATLQSTVDAPTAPLPPTSGTNPSALPQPPDSAPAGEGGASLGEDLLAAARARVPRDAWALEADSPDGYILVAPTAASAASVASPPSSVSSPVAVLSPRVLDPFAKERVTQYLASVGRRFEDVFFTVALDEEDHGGQVGFRCVAQLPVPLRFGDRAAIGEAASAPEAQQLAAMHAELVLDTLGICLFADGGKQRQHAEVCARQGRWAPSRPGEERPPRTASPPPLRRAHAGPLPGDRHRPRSITVSRAGRPVGGDVGTGDAVVEGEVERKGVESHGVSDTAGDSRNAAAEDLLPSMEGDEVAAAATLVAEAELDLVCKARVQYYLRRRGITAVEAVYTMVMGRGTILHEAAWSLPLPRGVFADDACEVKGIAATKRDAEVLSWMHAERVLDALGIPIFDNLPKLQQWHADRVARLQPGRTAPLAEHAAVPGTNTPDQPRVLASFQTTAPLPPTPPLRLSTTTIPQAAELVVPVPPDARVLEGSDRAAAVAAWAGYVEECAVYVQASCLAAHNAFFAVDRVPRTGDPLTDHTLDEVESQPVSVDRKRLLNNYCLAAGTHYPMNWKTQTVGPLLHRVSWTTFSVPGYEYVYAQGVGVNREVAQRRAATHALALLAYLDPDYASNHRTALHTLGSAEGVEGRAAASRAEPGTEGGSVEDVEEDTFDLDSFTVPLVASSQAGGKAPGEPAPAVRKKRKEAVRPVYDSLTGTFTAEGKVRAVELLSLCMGVAPPRVSHRIRVMQPSVDAPRRVRQSTVVTLVDDEGEEWTGSSTAEGKRLSEQLAYDELFGKLQAGLGVFPQVTALLMQQPLLNPHLVPNVTMSKAMKDRIHALVADVPAAELAEAAAAAGRQGEEAVDLASLAARRKATTDGDTAAAATWDEGGADVSRLLGSLAMSASQLAEESQVLLERHQAKITTAAYLEAYAPARERLAIAARRDDIVRGLDLHQVLIICGTTGCGKTTQVPQFILDHQTNQGSGGACSILVTQPRRLSAVSIAQRVAAERLERIGESVGYTIRFDARPGRHINFCTSGILLRMLHSSPTLEGITHLVIDEIHERDINSDFLIILLRDLLKQRPDLRLILMSATLQADQFGRYFNNAPVIHVEGYVYPVQELFLEDLVPYAEERGFLTPLLKEAAAVRRKATAPLYDVGDDRYGTNGTLSGRGGDAARTYAVLEATTDIDYTTIQFAIEQAMRMVDLSTSSVLVFLPGWEEITRAREILERDAKYQIMTLHSSIGQAEQMQCFLPAQEGKVKVILSTNIAESGVTIDDVGAVIDVGRAKERSYTSARSRTSVGEGQYNTFSQLLTVYASRANCVQRRGRVGRTRPGVCIRLYSRAHFDSLHDFQTPEMLRTPLDSLCLQILALNLGDPATFLERALEPPSSADVEAAMQRLHELGATTSTRELTPLGLRLSMLPVEPRMGKMIILGVLLRCLDTALTAASVTQTDVFVSARSSRDAMRLHKEDLSKHTQSDPIASVNGFNLWVTAHYQKSPAEVVSCLEERLLSVPQLMLVSRHKKQFYDILKNSGYLVGGMADEGQQDGCGGAEGDGAQVLDARDIFVDRSPFSRDALDVGLVKSVIAASLFPNVAMVQGRRVLRTKLQDHLATSSDSVLHRTALKDIQQPYFVYAEIAKASESSRLSVRDVTNVSLWTLLLLGSSSMQITYMQDLSLAFLDDWLPFRITFGTLELVRKLRYVLRRTLSRSYTDPTDAANNAVLEDVRLVLKALVNEPVTPNALGGGETRWVDAGVIISPETRKSSTAKDGEEGMRSSEETTGSAGEPTPEHSAVTPVPDQQT